VSLPKQKPLASKSSVCWLFFHILFPLQLRWAPLLLLTLLLLLAFLLLRAVMLSSLLLLVAGVTNVVSFTGR
jgi:hypothetical protein